MDRFGWCPVLEGLADCVRGVQLRKFDMFELDGLFLLGRVVRNGHYAEEGLPEGDVVIVRFPGVSDELSQDLYVV